VKNVNGLAYAAAAMLASLLLPLPTPAQQPPSLRGDGPAPPPRSFSITRADPGIDALVATDAKVELVASGFGLNEGTTWVRDGKGSGFLLVGGLLDNVLYKIASDNTVSVFMEKAGYSGDDRRLMRLEPDGTHTVLSEGGEGKRFSGPNDISIRSDGAIYLTDNDFGLRGAGRSPLKELANGVWRIKDGTTTRVLLDRDLAYPTASPSRPTRSTSTSPRGGR
jgi:gluconolactonase